MNKKTAIHTLSSDPALLLKTIPPRAVRNFLDRDRLKLSHFELAGASATILLAPTGFGKTAQLIQWRRDALAQGSLVFWLSLDNRDNPLRLVRGLAYSAQSACGKRGFAQPFMQWINKCSDPQEAMTGWLAEVARLAVSVLLLLDEADSMPAATRNQNLAYLLGNAPANLHIALAARPTSALMAGGALSTSSITRLTASDLRFQLEEMLTVLSASQGNPCNPEEVVSLYELTDGWPLGIQLAAATLHRSGSLEGLLSAGSADIRRYFIDSFIDRQPAEAIHLLVRMAQFDLIHPELCAAVIGYDAASQALLRLADETPLLLRSEDSDWMRLHPVAREVLRERLQQLPLAERHAMAKTAFAWYVAHNLYEEAAEQSYIAGNTEEAVELVERNIRQMAIWGRNDVIFAWYQRLSPEEIKQHPRFWAPVAWALSMGERHAEALHLIDLILAQPQLSPPDRFEADLITATIASYSDRADLTAELLDRWPEIPPQVPGHITAVYYVVKAMVKLQKGLPDQARLDFARLANFDRAKAYSPMSYGFADYGTGLSHIWEGRYALAEQELRPALTRAEEHQGRSNSLTCMLAALFALACWESGKDDNPVALLAGRLIVLEHHGLPDALMAAYKVLARIAERNDQQDQALNLLESLQAIGQARGILRLEVLAQFEQVRLHARRGRGDTARSLCEQLEALLQARRAEIPELFSRRMALHLELARAYASLANDALEQALQAAELAVDLAKSLKRGGYAVEALLLRAEALRGQRSPNARAAQDEAVSLAKAGGMVRLLSEFPALRREALLVPEKAGKEMPRETIPAPLMEALVLGAGLLTPKEREVLTLLSHNLSNREIAQAMDISEQTVKWHVKNLFSKLDAGSRKHAVARARMLGLIES